MPKEPVTITVWTAPKFRPLRALYTTSTVVGVIGIGALLDSEAMQWVGFVFLLLLGAALAVTQSRKNTAISIAEARELLTELEKEESR